MLSIIAATGLNNELGAAGKLLWRMSADMRRFKSLTTGHTVIMGRKTFESLPNGALPQRQNIVISANPAWSAPAVCVAPDLPAALALCKTDDDEIFIIGGAAVYRAAMPLVDKILLTVVAATFPEADVFFPEIDENQWIKTEAEAFQADAHNPYAYSFITYIKKK